MVAEATAPQIIKLSKTLTNIIDQTWTFITDPGEDMEICCTSVAHRTQKEVEWGAVLLKFKNFLGMTYYDITLQAQTNTPKQFNDSNPRHARDRVHGRDRARDRSRGSIHGRRHG